MRKRQKEKILKLLESFEQAHGEVFRVAQKEVELAFLLLEQCQQGAIQIGELIEQSEKECNTIIYTLENYCEWLYEQYGILDAGEGLPDSFLKEGHIFFKKIYREISEGVAVRRQAVFFPYKASMWDSLESVWMAMSKDPEWDVYVVPIPYYERNPDRSIGMVRVETTMFPSYVPIIHYTEYDLAENYPDMIFIHNPYDDTNFITTVDPCYYSENLRKYTDCLVYIPYFVLGEGSCSDDQYVNAVAPYCNLPAVWYADRVIVQSEQMRKLYIHVLTQFWGEETRIKWMRKILGIGSPKMDKRFNKRETIQLPESWKKKIYKVDGEKKKVVLYNIGLSAPSQYGKELLHKIENVLDVFERWREDIVLLWRPHPLLISDIKVTKPEILPPYLRLVNQFQNDGWGIYDDTPDLDRALIICDAYYGDGSSLVTLCQDMGKPILIQAIDQREEI